MFFGHTGCKNELHQIIQSKENAEKNIKSLEAQITALLNQVQELKAINHYQAIDHEKVVKDLKEENSSLKKRITASKPKPKVKK
jgi:hypothetical protein